MNNLHKIISSLKNANKHLKPFFTIKLGQKRLLLFLHALYLEGFIQSYSYNKDIKKIYVFLRFFDNKSSINYIKMYPLGSRILKLKYKDISLFKRGLGCLFLTTKHGIKPHNYCIEKKIGGNPLFFIS